MPPSKETATPAIVVKAASFYGFQLYRDDQFESLQLLGDHYDVALTSRGTFLTPRTLQSSVVLTVYFRCLDGTRKALFRTMSNNLDAALRLGSFLSSTLTPRSEELMREMAMN